METNNKFAPTINPMLVQIENEITAKVSKEHKTEFNRTITAAETLLFDPKSHQNMMLIKDPKSRENPVETISEGVSGLMWLLYIQSKRKLSVESMIYGGIVVITKVLDFADRGLKMQITNDVVARTVQRACEKLFERMGITPEQLMKEVRTGRSQIEDFHKHQAYLNAKMPSAQKNKPVKNPAQTPVSKGKK
jgi:hypothetical protein